MNRNYHTNEEIEIPKSLLSRIKNGKCVLFLGAGATISSGGSTGSELGKYIFDSIGDTGVDYKEQLSLYTEALISKGYRDDVERAVRKRFEKLKPSAAFSKISDVPWKAIYTTNYDDLVEKAYENQNYYHCVVNTILKENDIFGENDIPLYKLNGDIKTTPNVGNPLVITLNDLKDAKKKREKLLQKLMKNLCDTFVFVGYSFQDDNEIVTNLLEVLSDDERWESVKEKYVITPEMSEETRYRLSPYRLTHIKGTGDNFFKVVAEDFNNDYKAKLALLRKSFDGNCFLKDLKPQTQQYLIEAFDIYQPNEDYPVDGQHFYRGGRPNWGIIKNDFDVARKVTVKYENNCKNAESTTHLAYEYLVNALNEGKLAKILLKGASVSGKTTAIYRLAYKMGELGQLSLIYRQPAKYREGLLTEVAKEVKGPFLVFVDDVVIDTAEVVGMINEATEGSLPIVFVFSSRYSDWENRISAYYRKALSPFSFEIEMSDSFTDDEATRFVDKLIESGVVQTPTTLDKMGLIKKVKRRQNILEVLLEVIEDSRIEQCVVDEYDALQDRTKDAYGIISLSFRHGYKIKWEVLQRTLSQKEFFSWEDFINLVLRRDAKGNIYDDEIQGNYYLFGRNRYICQLICDIRYKGNYSQEIEAIKAIIEACADVDSDEKFMGGLLNAIIKDEEISYNDEQIESLLNHAIETFSGDSNQAFVNHLRGEFFLSIGKLNDAKMCFETNVENGLNIEYSLHSLGKTYYKLARNQTLNSAGFILNVDKAIQKLEEGVTKFKANEFYYGLLFSIFDYLKGEGALSEKNNRVKEKIEKLALESLGPERVALIKNGKEISMY